MVKRSNTAITKSDIESYVAEPSDFDFEMSVLRELHNAGFSCAHAGTYRDPVTEKIRSYDFRARREVATDKHIRLAVECKNIRPSSPLLVYATPRTTEESFHTLLIRKHDLGFDLSSTKTASGSIYPQLEYVGRNTDQVSRNQSGDFIGGDSVAFEKLLQALHSTQDLVNEAAREPNRESRAIAIVPLVVVPDDLLWQIDYAANGSTANSLRQVSRTTLVCRHAWHVKRPQNTMSFVVSHLELVTLSGLISRLNYLADTDGLFADSEHLVAIS